MNVVCIGGGYVGCVTAVSFAVLGTKTTIVDINEEKINLLNSGKAPIYEPGIEQLIKQTIGNMLFATTEYDCIKEADIIFICVETPTASDGSADLSRVKKAAFEIGRNINKTKFTVIVNKSTVPVGTGDVVFAIIAEASGLKPDKDFAVVSNPEFLREGSALRDVFFPDRIVVGTNNQIAEEIMKKLYEPIVTRKNYSQLSAQYFYLKQYASDKYPIYFSTDVKTAEMIKYTANAFLAVKVSFINEIAMLCEKLGINVLEVAKGIGLDSRIGEKFLEVSPGWQGTCFPKDTSELYLTSKRYNQELTILKAAIDANWAMHRYVVEKIVNFLGCLNGKTIGILGLTFKPDTDDARRTQAQFIIPHLLSLGARIRVFDPQGMEMFKRFNPHLDIVYCNKGEDVAYMADCILLLTHWQEFKSLNWREMYRILKTPYILDARNFLSRSELEEAGFYYQGLGVGKNSGRPGR